jgi:hypothetical protein
MSERKSVVHRVDDVTLTDVQNYLVTSRLPLRRYFTVSHDGLPFDMAFERLEDAEHFFRVEVQARHNGV